ncbi:glycosyltransferase [Bacteroides faecichinchillae]
MLVFDYYIYLIEVSPTRNALLEAAKGVYVGIVDSDDTVAPDAFEQLYR